jgi:hypothetical protein
MADASVIPFPVPARSPCRPEYEQPAEVVPLYVETEAGFLLIPASTLRIIDRANRPWWRRK